MGTTATNFIRLERPDSTSKNIPTIWTIENMKMENKNELPQGFRYPIED